MKIKIIDWVPTKPQPKIGEIYEVLKINKRRRCGDVYFVKCEGKEVGVLGREFEIVKDDAQ